MRLTIALLAAGSSRRFGTANKLMELWQGKPLIAHAAKVLRGVSACHHIAICAAQETALQTLLQSAGFEVLINTHAEKGLSGSVRVAAEFAIRQNAHGLLIALGDMPHVSPAHYAALASGISAQAITASRPINGSANMPPIYFGRSAVSDLLNVDGEYGARDMIASAPFITAPAQELRDFDVASDFV